MGMELKSEHTVQFYFIDLLTDGPKVFLYNHFNNFIIKFMVWNS